MILGLCDPVSDITPRHEPPDGADHLVALLVEDTPGLFDVVTRVLDDVGITYQKSVTGAEAVKKILKSDYKMVFMDI